MTGFMAYAESLEPGQPYPVDQWHPPFCGNIDMRIARDGSWFYNGTPIARSAMVQLFARLLRKEGDDYYLVTPAEKVGIMVEDVPFIAVEMTVEHSGTSDQTLTFRTSIGDAVTADAAHPLRFETDKNDGFKPYVEVRAGLFARLSRTLAQDLAALIEPNDDDQPGIRSAGAFYPIS